MAFDFSAVFSITGTAFSVAGTYADGSGTSAGIRMIMGEPTGEIQTAEGVFVPSCDEVCHIAKSQLSRLPARGGIVLQGTYVYDVVNPAREDASRLEWALDLKRRQT